MFHCFFLSFRLWFVKFSIYNRPFVIESKPILNIDFLTKGQIFDLKTRQGLKLSVKGEPLGVTTRTLEQIFKISREILWFLMVFWLILGTVFYPWGWNFNK